MRVTDSKLASLLEDENTGFLVRWLVEELQEHRKAEMGGVSLPVTSPTLDLAALRELAAAATTGPWHAEPFSRSGDKPPMWRGRVFFLGADNPKTNTRDCDLTIADARYIAASSPDVVVALLDEIDRLRALVNRIDETLHVPAAEYVPAISDVFALIDKAKQTETKP